MCRLAVISDMDDVNVTFSLDARYKHQSEAKWHLDAASNTMRIHFQETSHLDYCNASFESAAMVGSISCGVFFLHLHSLQSSLTHPIYSLPLVRPRQHSCINVFASVKSGYV